MRDYSDSRFFGVHRLLVDAYALQHPERHCASTKSLLAHLCGLACAFEHDGSPTAYRLLKRSLDGEVVLTKPPLPPIPRAVTIADVAGTADAAEHAERVDNWARAVWDGYATLQPFARDWLTRVA